METVNIHGKEYETVASRVLRFKADHSDLSIITELISVTDKTVTFKASIVDNTGRVLSTGHGQESFSDGNINRTAGVENCETSAVGRALAFFGYGGTDSIASADEMQKAIKKQNQKPQKNYEQSVEVASLFFDFDLFVKELQLDNDDKSKVDKLYKMAATNDANLTVDVINRAIKTLSDKYLGVQK